MPGTLTFGKFLSVAQAHVAIVGTVRLLNLVYDGQVAAASKSCFKARLVKLSTSASELGKFSAYASKRGTGWRPGLDKEDPSPF